MADVTGKEALERLARASIGEGRHPVEYSTIRAIATDFAALEARAIAAEERVKEERDAGISYGIAMSVAHFIRDVDRPGLALDWWNAAGLSIAQCERLGVDEYDLEPIRAALAGGKPKAERPTVNDRMAILRRLADGDTIVYSQDGDYGWFTKGDRALVGDEIILMRARGFIKSEIDPTDETDNYRGMAEYDTISDLGRRYLKEQSR